MVVIKAGRDCRRTGVLFGLTRGDIADEAEVMGEMVEVGYVSDCNTGRL